MIRLKLMWILFIMFLSSFLLILFLYSAAPELHSSKAVVESVPPTSSLRRTSYLPVVVFVSHRLSYLQQTLKTIQVAATDRLELITCYFAIDVQQATLDIFELLESIDFCDVKIINNSYPNIPDPEYLFGLEGINISKTHITKYRMTKLWTSTLDYVFRELAIASYVLFVEEDTPLSPDHRDVAEYLAFAMAHPHRFPIVSNDLSQTAYAGLGGWNGEHMINADPLTFILRHSRFAGFPTMGYIMNSTFWELFRPEFLKLLTDPRGSGSHGYDWSSMLSYITNNTDLSPGAHKYSILLVIIVFHSTVRANSLLTCIVVLLPTFSRSWHIGASSTLGGKWLIQSNPPWERDHYFYESCAGLLATGNASCLNYFIIKDKFRDSFGVPCRLILNNRSTCWNRQCGKVVCSPLCQSTFSGYRDSRIWPLDERYSLKCYYNDGYECPIGSGNIEYGSGDTTFCQPRAKTEESSSAFHVILLVLVLIGLLLLVAVAIIATSPF